MGLAQSRERRRGFNWASVMSPKIRRERTEIECWRGFRADERVKLEP